MDSALGQKSQGRAGCSSVPWNLIALCLPFKNNLCITFGCAGSLLLRTGFCCRVQALGCMGSVVVAQVLSRSVACDIFLDQGLNPCPLHWQAGSLPLSDQGSPIVYFLGQVLIHCTL